ncbi:MAG: dephospho-CoA kinase [Anaerolineaceae bacterium]|nr:dephospho-CoA kinase [Anaerolineaceae bacterium]
MGRWPGKTVIGLTGNIAVGKSQVLGQLESLGAGVIDADRVAREVLEPGGAAHAAVVAEFGEALLDGQGRLDRAALGRVVFSDAAALARLEALTHPVIRRRIDALVRAAPQGVLVIEAIKLLEGDLAEAVDAVWVVDAAPETQLERLTGQRGMSPADARQRLRAQNPQADKLARADLVIRNDGSLAALQERVRAAWESLADGLSGRAR